MCSSHARTQLHRWRCVVQTHRSRTSLTNTTSHPKQLGRLTHYAFDAVLLSAFLAGVKRSTGLTYVAHSFHHCNTSHLETHTSLPLPPILAHSVPHHQVQLHKQPKTDIQTNATAPASNPTPSPNQRNSRAGWRNISGWASGSWIRVWRSWVRVVTLRGSGDAYILV